MNEAYIEKLMEKFGPRYDAIFRFAIVMQSLMEAQSEVFELSSEEKLAVIGLTSVLMAQEHVQNAVDEADELLGPEELD